MLKKIWGRYRKKYLLSSALTVGMLCVVYMVSGLFPFGGKTLAWGDMTQQVLPFMMQFKNIAAGNQGLLFSMGNAAGMNFWGVFLFFIASPFTVLGLLVPKAWFYEFANILVMLKMVLAACAATAFFAHRHSLFTCRPWQAGILGVMYAFSGYTLMYYQNIVWLDQLILFPLVMMALRLLLKEGRIAPLAAGIAVCMFLQFQIGYMVVLTLVICGAMHIFLYVPKGQKGHTALRLGAAAGLAAALSCVVWLPALLQYRRSARESGKFLDNFLYSKYFTHMETTLITLLCTAAVFAGILFLFFRKRFFTPGVPYTFACFVLFTIPLLLEPINRMWHAGNYQAFPTRYGFIPLFFGLMLLSAAFEKMNELPARKRSRDAAVAAGGGAVVVYLFLLLYILLFLRQDASHYVHSLWGNEVSLKLGALVFAAGAGVVVLLLFLRQAKLLNRRMCAVLLCCVVALEGCYNGILYIGSAAYQNENFKLMMDLSDRLPEDDTTVKLSRKYTDANNIGAMGYQSIAHYSSLTRWDYLNAGKKLGYSGYWMEMSGLGGTPLSDSFLNIGAVICQRDEIDPLYDAQQVVYQNEWYALVRPPVQPTQGLVVAADAGEIATIPEGDRFAAQDWMYNRIYGQPGALCRRYTPDYLQNAGISYSLETQEYYAFPYEGEEDSVYVYNIEVTQAETLYFDCFRYISNNLQEPVNDGFAIWVNGVFLEGSYPNGGCNGLLCLGTFENETVEVQVQLLREEVMRSFGVCGIRLADVQRAVAGAKSAQVEIEGRNIHTVVEAQAKELLVLPVAYDEGFSAFINGQPAAVHKVLDGFIAVELAAGENVVELHFTPPGFALGSIVLLPALLLLLAAFVLEQRRKRKNVPATGLQHTTLSKISAAVALFLLAVVFAAVVVMVYIMPVVWWLQGEKWI